MFYVLIFISVFVATSSLQSMEIIKKVLLKNKKYCNPIIENNIVVNKISKKYNLPQEIIFFIKKLSELSRNKDFEQAFPRIKEWKNFSIPLTYHQLLSSKQIDVVKTLFSKAIHLTPCRGQIFMMYDLDSNQQYKVFTTIPIAFRLCLTKPPHYEQKVLLHQEPHESISKDNIILVGPNAKQELIIPENLFIDNIF